MKLASSFGGGMGRLREVCGAVSGMFMAVGLAEGFPAPPESGSQKMNHYKTIQELAARFKAENASIVCRELLGLEKKDQGEAAQKDKTRACEKAAATVAGDPYSPQPEARTADYYKKRPCPDLCACAADILAEFLKERQEKDLQEKEKT